MANDVTTTFFANASAAEAAIAKLEKKYDDLENKLKQVSKRSREQSDMPALMGSWATRMGGVLSAYTGISSAINQAYQAQIQMNQAADAANTKYDELIRKLRVQGGMSGTQGAEAQQRLTRIAAGTASGFTTAQGASEELLSQGFDVATATGGGAKRLLETIKATNAKEGDVKQITAAYSALLAATGQEKNQENLDKVTLAVQRTFKGTPLQAPDLAQLAPKIQGVSSAVPWDEALAQFAVMKEKSSPEVASTALKIFWERMQTASTDQKMVGALSQMGLTPDAVDAIGEKPAEVLDRLAGGLEKLKPEERAGAMKALFGQEAMSAASGLIRDREKVAEYRKLQGDEAGFQEDLRISTRGASAAKARAELEQEQQMLRRDASPEELMRAAELLNRDAGASEAVLGLHRQMANARMLFGQDPTAAVAGAFTDPAEIRKGLMSSGATLPPELLQAKVAELRGQIPGGVGAEQFLEMAGEGLSGPDKVAAQKRALEALGGEEGAAEKLLKENTEATKEQTAILREFLEKNARKPARKPGGSEE
jgi:hypothetical protein